jgi:two-component system chemotaxis response regulator CheB
MPGHDIIAVGGSAGAFEALRDLLGGLPANLPASLFVVTHLQPYSRSNLPAILSRFGPLPARHPEDREPIRPGTVYVAPPDRHLLVGPEVVRVVEGPRENNARPAIDPLFRTAALAYGPRVVGVVLSGLLDDGTAGLAAVKARGGTALVQRLDDALHPEMPASALRHVRADRVLPAAEIADELVRLAHEPPAGPAPPAPKELEWEASMAEWGLDALQGANRPGRPSPFTCPHCKGDLWEIENGGPPRFRCRTGHAFSLLTLLASQAEAVEAALNEAFRALKEKEHLEARAARRAREGGNRDGVAYHERQSKDAAGFARVLRDLLVRLREAGKEVTPEGEPGA